MGLKRHKIFWHESVETHARWKLNKNGKGDICLKKTTYCGKMNVHLNLEIISVQIGQAICMKIVSLCKQKQDGGVEGGMGG